MAGASRWVGWHGDRLDRRRRRHQRTDFNAGGAPRYGAVQVCDAALAERLRGAGASAALADLRVTSQGTAYVLLRLATPDPAGKKGDSLLAAVSSHGVAVVPAAVLAGGTAAAMDTDDAGHLYVLLGAPGRSNVAVRRYAPDLSADWSQPISPYLLGAPTAVPQEPVAISAASGAVIAWREGGSVKLQRYGASGGRIWLLPPAVATTGTVMLAADGFAGCYLVGVSSGDLSVHHFSAAGLPVGGRAGVSLSLTFADPRADAVSVDRAGDLSVAYRDAAAAGSAGVACITFLGSALNVPALTPAQAQLTALSDDGAGGCYALGAGAGARLWRLGFDGAALTVRARAAAITYGAGVDLSGYLTNNGAPVADKSVDLTVPDGRGSHQTVTATTDAQGYYAARVAPGIDCSISALARGVGGSDVSAASAAIAVSPRVTLTLTHRAVGARYVETLAGAARPGQAGSPVFLQRRTADGTWRTLLSSRLDASSRYRMHWLVPRRTATYLLRVFLPAQAESAAGISPAARLRVVSTRRALPAFRP